VNPNHPQEKEMTRFGPTDWFQGIAILAAFAIGAVAAADTPSGREILDAAGIQGGLVVHLGCGDGRLTAQLRGDKRYLVHGLDADPSHVAAARDHLQSLGVYGPVSVDRLSGDRLPYADNLVNLLVSEDLGDVPLDEVNRVLAPLGVAYLKQGDRWVKTARPWPEDIDSWTHFLHGPDNNAVARDRVVGPPSGLQWISDPIHLRSHEHLNSVSSVVSSAGRIFYVIDEGPTSAVIAPPQWRLIARDAFSGVLLWKREIGPWEGHFRVFRSGPPGVARRLVAVDGRVYATLGYGKRVAAFDTASGKTLHVYDGTEGALEIVCTGEQIFVVVGDIDLTPPADPGKRFYPQPAPRNKGLVAVDTASGEVLWSRRSADTAELMPTTMAISRGRLFYQNPADVVCLDATTGEELWRAERPVYTERLSWSAPTLVATPDVVLSADGSTGGLPDDVRKGREPVEWVMSDQDIRRHPPGDVVAFSAKDGTRLWSDRSLQGFCNPGDLFVVDDQVWCGADVGTGQALLNVAVDLKTGAVKSSRPQDGWPVAGHTRCYRSKATERFLILGDVGVEFVDLDDWRWNANPWVRGTCQYGVMPSNGLLYVPPDSCACRPEMRLHGFSAMAPRRSTSAATSANQPQLQSGPAFDWAPTAETTDPAAAAEQWPTYRRDPARSGNSPAPVPTDLAAVWQAQLGGQLTSPTIAENRVFVSRVDTHTVYALDATTGQQAWSCTVGGPVDSPPTIFGELVLFGCRDGHVYCVRHRDGQLVWRFRAADESRTIVAMDRVESAWPVHGSVLVHEGKVWFAAGRSPFLDGGIHVYALDAVSGKVAVKRTIFSRGPQQLHTSPPEQPGDVTAPGMPDILSASDGTVYMRWMGFDQDGNTTNVRPHLFSATGFLDDTWWHRTYWQYGVSMQGGFGGWPKAAMQVPAGRIMVVGPDTLFSYDRSEYDSGNGGDVHAGHIGVVKRDYQDSGRVDHTQNPFVLYAVAKPDAMQARRRAPKSQLKWQTSVPLLVRAMLVADQTLFIAGPHEGTDNHGLMHLAEPQPGALWAISAADGTVQSKCELAVDPVLDGMAAAGERLYLVTRGGDVCCFGRDE
jgi:outer membrane protein assembly factor BamB